MVSTPTISYLSDLAESKKFIILAERMILLNAKTDKP
jgi:hypothetical protein